MNLWVKVGIDVASLGALLVVSVALGMSRWNRATEQSLRRLASGVDSHPSSADGDSAQLPAPVARYFAFALGQRSTRATTSRAEWSGTFLMKRGARTSPFAAIQHFQINRPGFVWDADIRMMPIVSVRVRDSYIDGTGAMLARVGGLFSVADQRGSREIAEASLQRYLGEAVWFPAALLPSSGVRWTSIDDITARATLVDHENTATVDFHFGPQGEIVGCSAMRQRDVDGASVLTPWRTRTWDYEAIAGVMVPRSAEAEWILSDGPLTYWRGRLERLTYE